jgi:multimeric flavodoxin WrbA
MKIYVLDGGPRKGWNTNLMCESFAEAPEARARTSN